MVEQEEGGGEARRRRVCAEWICSLCALQGGLDPSVQKQCSKWKKESQNDPANLLVSECERERKKERERKRYGRTQAHTFTHKQSDRRKFGQQIRKHSGLGVE